MTENANVITETYNLLSDDGPEKETFLQMVRALADINQYLQGGSKPKKEYCLTLNYQTSRSKCRYRAGS